MPSKYALPMFRRWGLRRMWRYPSDAAAKHGYGFQVWGFGFMLHGKEKEQGLFIGWLQHPPTEGESDGE